MTFIFININFFHYILKSLTNRHDPLNLENNAKNLHGFEDPLKKFIPNDSKNLLDPSHEKTPVEEKKSGKWSLVKKIGFIAGSIIALSGAAFVVHRSRKKVEIPTSFHPASFDLSNVCLKDKDSAHLPDLSSNTLFCSGYQKDPLDLKPKPMGSLSRLGKAFKMSLSVDVTNQGNAKQQWHSHSERHAIPEEPNVQSSVNEMHRRLIKLQQQAKSLEHHLLQNKKVGLKTISKSLDLLWERQWDFLNSCGVGKTESTAKKWCEAASKTLISDVKTIENHLREETQAFLLPALENSQFSHLKELFHEKKLKVSPELLLASNAYHLKNDYEVNALSQFDLLSQMFALFENVSDIPAVISLKESLACAKEVQEKVIIPFRNYSHTLDPRKYTGYKGMETRMKQAVAGFKDILSKQLTGLESKNLHGKKSILIPGGLSGTNGSLAKLAPHLSRALLLWTKENQMGALDFKDLLTKIESWLFNASKVAYYEIEPDSDGKYTFRIYYGRPNNAHPEEVNSEGIPSFQSSVSMSGISKEALLSDSILHTLLETQLVGDLVREVEHYSFDFLPSKKEKNTPEFPKESEINSEEPEANDEPQKDEKNFIIEKLQQIVEVISDHTISAATTVGNNLQTFGTSVVDSVASSGGGRQANWNEKLFEENLFHVLGGTKNKRESAGNIPVNSSTSPEWDTLLAVMQQKGSSPEESKRLIIGARLALLHHFCTKTDPVTLGNQEQTLSILSAAQQTLARWTLSPENHPFLNKNDLDVIRLIVLQSDQLISKAKEIEAARLKKESPSVALKVPFYEEPFGVARLPGFEVRDNVKIPLSDSIYRPIEQIVDWHPSEGNWTQELQEFSKSFMQQIEADNLPAVIDAVELLAEKSEILLSLVSKTPPEAVEPAITTITEIAQAYFAAHFDAKRPIHPDARGFATIMVLLELGEELRQMLPKELGLNDVTLYGKAFEKYFGIEAGSEWGWGPSNTPIPMAFRLYDPAWDKRIQRIAEKNKQYVRKNREDHDKSQNLLSMNLSYDPQDENFGSTGEMGLGVWRYRQWMWPLGLEAARVSYQEVSDSGKVDDHSMFEPLFNDALPYRKLFTEKFPKIAKDGDKMQQIAAAYEDPSESCLPKSFYNLRNLGTMARYFLRSPFVTANGPVKDRNTYVNKFHAVYNPEVSIPVPQFALDRQWFSEPRIRIIDKKVRFFSEVRGIDQEFLNTHPNIEACSNDFDDCHRFKGTHDPFQNDLLNGISSHLGGDKFHVERWGHWHIIDDFELRDVFGRRGLDINKAMTEKLSQSIPGGLDWKDYVRLRAIFSHKETQISSAASFFSNRLHLFEGNEKKEWRAFLQQTLFEPGLILDTLSKPSEREDMIRALDFFCNKGYRYFHSLQKNDEAAYFQEVSLMLGRYIEQTRELNVQDPSDLKILNNTLLVDQLRKTVAIEGTLTERQKGPFAGVLAKHLLEEYKIYTDEELSEILEGVMLYYRYPSQVNAESRQRREAIVKGMRRIAPQVKKLMADEIKRNSLLKKLVARIEPSETNTEVFATDSDGLRYVSKLQNLKIDLLEGRLLKTGLGDQTLPIEVLENPSYRIVFGDHEHWVKLLSPTSWEFVDKHGHLCRINKDGEGFQILRQLKDKRWYRYLSPEIFSQVPVSNAKRQMSGMQGLDDRTSLLGSLQFIDGYTHWYHEGSSAEILLLDPKTSEQRYQVHVAHSPSLSSIGAQDMVYAIHDLSQTPPLKLVNIYKEAFQYAWLENMEDLRHVMLWKDQHTGELKRIELPRYRRFREIEKTEEADEKETTNEKLSFTVVDKKAYCDQIPGYYLEARQHNDQLPHLKSLLMLRNAEGDQKMILPYWEPQAQPGLSLQPRFLDPRSTGITQHDYIILEKAKENGHFAGVDIQAHLYQALILQTQHRYAEAAEILTRHGHNPKTYSISQRKVFESIIQFAVKRSRDEQPDAYLPAMQVIILLIKDHIAHGSDTSLFDPYIKTIYLTYYKNRTDKGHLSFENTALVARYLLEKENQLGGDVKQQYLELSEIDPAAAHQALSDYAHKMFSQNQNLLDGGIDIFSQINPFEKKDQKSPYEKIKEVSEFELIKLFQSTLSSKSTSLATGLRLQPTETEFVKQFLTFLKKMQNGTEKERKEIADRCRLIQSQEKSIVALSQLLIEFSEHPQAFLKEISSIDLEKKASKIDIDTLVKKLIHVSLTTASKEIQASSNEAKDYSSILFGAINRFTNSIPQFDPQKFASKPNSKSNETKSPIHLPEPVKFGSLMEEWKPLLVLSQDAGDNQAEAGMKRYQKIVSPYLSNTEQSSLRHKEESTHLINSIDAYLKNHQGVWSFKDPQARLEMIQQRESLRGKVLTHEKELASRELEILIFFNRSLKDQASAIKMELKQLGGDIKKRTLPELILLFTRKELNILAEERGLTNEEIKIGSRLIANYLTTAKRKDGLKYALLPLIDKLASSKPSDYGTAREQELLEDVAAQLHVVPQTDPEEQPAVSGFEYFNRLIVRGEQWEKIQELQEFFKKAIANEEGAPRHLVQKLEMGFGKTFLLMPIYGFCAADGNKLSMALLPKELIEDMSKEISGMLGNTFEQRLQRLDFDRNTEFTVKRLEDILSTLSDTKRDRQFLMMTSQSVRSFYLKFIETWSAYSEAVKKPLVEATTLQSYEQKILLMQKILNLWEKADVLFDEEDLILNSKQRLSFAMGGSTPLPAERLGLTVELYRVLTSPSFQKIANLHLEFLNHGDSDYKKEPFTQTYYEETVKPLVARLMLDRLSQKMQNAHETSSFAKNFPDLSNTMKNWSPNEMELVSAFILDKDTSGKGYAFIKNLKSEPLRQVLSLLKGQLNDLLPLTLNRNYAERYGFHTQNDPLAGPFSGSNTPNKGSQFTDPWEIANYSIQAHFKRNDYRKLVKDVVTKAREQARKEKMVKGCDLDQTDAYIHFENEIGKRCGVSLFQENAIEKINIHTTNDISFQLYLMEKYVLPEIKEFPMELSATSQAFSLIFNITKGFTGTPWNWQTFPQGTKVSAIADTDGATLIPLYKKSSNRVFEVSCKNENRAASLFNDNPSFKNAQPYIDSGGILKGIPHEEIARQLFTLPWFRDSYDGILFFDEKGNKKVLEKNAKIAVSSENSNIPIEKRFTFYDQKHSTGTNIKQLPHAKGVISVSKQMILRDLMQGAKRLRQLHKGQQLDIVIHSDDAAVIREALNLPKEQRLGFDEVIFYLWKQQLERIGEENFSSATHKMQAKLQRPIFELMKDPSKNPKDIARWLPKAQSLFFKEISDNPFARYGEPKVMKPKNQVIEMKANELLKSNISSIFLEESQLKSPSISSAKGLNQWVQSAVNLEHLDDKLTVTSGLNDHETEMELEQETEQEAEIESEIEQQMEQELQVSWRRKPVNHIPMINRILSNEDSRSISLYQWIGRHRNVKNNFENNNIFDPAIRTSHNQQNSFEGHERSSGARLFKPVEYVLIHAINKKGKKHYELTIIDTNDAADAQKELQQVREKIDPSIEGWTLYALGVGQIQHAGLGIEGKPGYEEPALLSLLVQAKFADGEIYYNEAEQKVLRAWIERTGVDKVESEIKYILRDQPSRREGYAASSLAKVIQLVKENRKS